MGESKPKRGRPPVPQEKKKKFKSISIPDDIWDRILEVAELKNISIGKLATGYCLYGLMREKQQLREKRDILRAVEGEDF